jgi:hypothetical protein
MFSDSGADQHADTDQRDTVRFRFRGRTVQSRTSITSLHGVSNPLESIGGARSVPDSQEDGSPCVSRAESDDASAARPWTAREVELHVCMDVEELTHESPCLSFITQRIDAT